MLRAQVPREGITWEKGGRKVKFWYSLRMEHVHTLPVPWDLEDDFRRVEAWQSLGVDDVLDVSVPWSADPEVSWKDSLLPPTVAEPCPVMVREYSTPSGDLRHAVRKTGEDPGEGWVIQPDHVPLIEDYNIPRGFEHAVSTPADVPRIGHLYRGPDAGAKRWFDDRMEKVTKFAHEHAVPVQAWSAFGMDAVVWLAGVQGAVMMAVDDPGTFSNLVDAVAEGDWGRTMLACSHPAVDLIVERGLIVLSRRFAITLCSLLTSPYVNKGSEGTFTLKKMFLSSATGSKRSYASLMIFVKSTGVFECSITPASISAISNMVFIIIMSRSHSSITVPAISLYSSMFWFPLIVVSTVPRILVNGLRRS